MLQILILVAVCIGVYFLVLKVSTNGGKPIIMGIKKPKIGQKLTMDDTYNASKLDKKNEMNRVLDKIHKRGIDSLTKKEKLFLGSYSKTSI